MRKVGGDGILRITLGGWVVRVAGGDSSSLMAACGRLKSGRISKRSNIFLRQALHSFTFMKNGFPHIFLIDSDIPLL